MQIDFWRPNGIGDTLLLAPTLQGVRYFYPEARIRVWGNPDAAYLLGVYGLCDAAENHHNGLRLRHRPDVFIGWDWDESGLRLACQALQIPTYSVAPFIAPPGVHQARHCFKEARAMLPRLEGAHSGQSCPLLVGHLPDIDEEYAGAVVLCMGGSMPEKRWPAGRFAELAEHLTATGQRVVFVEAPGENYGETPAPALSRNLLGMAWLASRAAAWVGNDTGPTHLAAMTGCPTIALFGASNPAIWHPVGPHVEVLMTCERMLGRSDHFWCRNHDCWRDLSVDAVEQAVHRALGSGVTG